jgi:hypothetical protein
VSKIIPFIVFLSLHAFLLHGCRCGGEEVDLYGFMPADTAAVLDVDMKGLYGTGPGKRYVDSTISKDDCLYPLVAQKAGRVLVGYGGGKRPAPRAASPFMIAECRGCGMESFAACITRHFVLSFDRKEAVTIGGLKFIPSDSNPPVYLSRLKKHVFFLGLRDDAERVAAAVKGKQSSLRGSEQVALLNRDLPGAAAVRLLVLRAHDVRGRLLPPEDEFSSELSVFDRACFGLAVSGGSIALSGSLIAGKGKESRAAESAGSLDKKIRETASNPLLRQMGVSDLLRKVAFKGEGAGRIGVTFTIEEEELFDFIHSHQGVIKIGL